MKSLSGKRILLGITGSIAAYKAVILLRLLNQLGADVRVVMTKNAGKFVTPLTFQALSNKPIHMELLDYQTEFAMGHIELARQSDLILVVPASANFIARYANGFADDLLSTLCLVANDTVMLAPAMNQQMWLNPATQENISKLKDRGIKLLGPIIGDQICGETGPGRMMEPADIVDIIAESFQCKTLSGLRLLVTAGPTREAVDPVRFLSNRSSGRMGYAVAKAALEAGAQVDLITGPVNLPKPDHISVTNVTSAIEMYNAVMSLVNNADIFISTAAVADYSLQTVMDQKIKKNSDTLELKLKKTPDILARVAKLENSPFTVGFAAETEDMMAKAQTKLRIKKLDMIAANQVGETIGFDSAFNALTVFWRTGHKQLEKMTKEKLAKYLIQLIAERYNQKISNRID